MICCSGGPGHLVQLHQGLQPRLVEPQFLFRPLALGDVACDFGKTAQNSGIVENGSNDDVRPESRAVFADPPALVLETAFRDGPSQLLRRFSRVDVFGRIEAGEVPAKDFFGARIP